jgi:hypothetical protein
VPSLLSSAAAQGDLLFVAIFGAASVVTISRRYGAYGETGGADPRSRSAQAILYSILLPRRRHRGECLTHGPGNQAAGRFLMERWLWSEARPGNRNPRAARARDTLPGLGRSLAGVKAPTGSLEKNTFLHERPHCPNLAEKWNFIPQKNGTRELRA